MVQAVEVSERPTNRRVRFARLAAGAAFLFALAGLIYSQFALVAAGAVSGAIGLVTAAMARDVYAAAGIAELTTSTLRLWQRNPEREAKVRTFARELATLLDVNLPS
jgi:hypothetical protein